MAQDILFRSRLRTILDEIEADLPPVSKVDIAELASLAGTNRQTLYNWINADTDNPEDWFKQYNPAIAIQLEEILSELAGRQVKIFEAMRVGNSKKKFSLRRPKN